MISFKASQSRGCFINSFMDVLDLMVSLSLINSVINSKPFIRGILISKSKISGLGKVVDPF
jgi:hypothetical protein